MQSENPSLWNIPLNKLPRIQFKEAHLSCGYDDTNPSQFTNVQGNRNNNNNEILGWVKKLLLHQPLFKNYS